MIADGLKSLAVDIDTVKLMEDNPRRGDVAAVKRSYARFGQVKPIVATPDMTVIAGNHSLIAARELGWTEIAVNVVPFDSEEAKAYALADNRTADLGTYDNDTLAELLAEVAVDSELLLATGYTEADVEALIGDVEVVDFPELSSEDREPFQRMTFTVHDEEVKIIEQALSVANGTTIEQLAAFTTWLRNQGVTATQINEATGTFMGGHYLTSASQPAIPTPTAWEQIKHLVKDVPSWITELIDRKERIKISSNDNERGSALARICQEWTEAQDDGKSAKG